jgi:pimeloyl-ACP methyl ester carboxylesterase
MPIIKAGPFDVDYAEAGKGPAVLLLHSSAAGNRQWRVLMEERFAKNHLVSANLFGYGATSAWPGERPLTLDDQANLVAALSHFLPERFALVGHSLGAAIALHAAPRLTGRLDALVLFEPILFYLLRERGEAKAFEEVDAVRRACLAAHAAGDIEHTAQLFIDFWSGHGAWDATADERKSRMLATIPALMHEWDMIFGGASQVEAWRTIKAPVHVLFAADTRLATRTVADLLRGEFPHWRFHTVPAGGHIAPITRPDLVNPAIAEILDRVPAPR